MIRASISSLVSREILVLCDISVKIAREIYSGESTDPTNGALWYHADYVSPYWKDSFVQGPKIGQHIFYQDTRKINS